MTFISAYKQARSQSKNDLAFIFVGTEMFVTGTSVPAVSGAAALFIENKINAETDGRFFGTIGDQGCFVYELSADCDLKDYTFVPLRSCVGALEPGIDAAAGYASHLLHWYKHSVFCGRCGSANSWYKNECAKLCPSCGNIQFPKISPAIIIRIHRGDEILLAHNKRFPEGRYSLLAGFVEIGETIEETAIREVREEVGIEIENVRYISSQSWPFPDSLMLGLTADYKSGEIKPDGVEIVHADWYTAGNFPSIPGHGTIARKIIDEYTKTYKS